ncbi:MAG: hypothetical protein K2P48_00005 [Lachnospiraceae bacterium]|nr:hypothetical protein [Lachnospiraceae bacterium]
MAIGAINAYGAMNAVSFRPYVYNANTVNSASMNKLSRISDNVLDKKIDYNELTDESLNENPLKKGQTLDFQGMLDRQMRRGQNIAARIMRPMEAEDMDAAAGTAQMTGGTEAAARFDLSETEEVQAVEERAAEAAADGSGGNINYQMQQALRAYEMFMTA